MLIFNFSSNHFICAFVICNNANLFLSLNMVLGILNNQKQLWKINVCGNMLASLINNTVKKMIV